MTVPRGKKDKFELIVIKTKWVLFYWNLNDVVKWLITINDIYNEFLHTYFNNIIIQNTYIFIYRRLIQIEIPTILRET